MATYDLNQKASNETSQSGRQAGQTANDNSGIHNSILTWTAGRDLTSDLSTDSGGIGQTMSELPMWVWIAAIGGVGLWAYFRRKKKK